MSSAWKKSSAAVLVTNQKNGITLSHSRKSKPFPIQHLNLFPYVEATAPYANAMYSMKYE
jgi:hypothetical protein